ncbi:polysaccharide biosynthesis/export family protein [Methylopila sp. Yamaguchi]|uniref:polysaccharide biosynthesis/export family protein n=1 Tax=Methylopila sp. Yamaguchi TaxID=1437817 RepID=UPI00135A215C|nr:polysaccharide biosynthesis/export family protein [Methylopila sp. Yamaguchi]
MSLPRTAPGGWLVLTAAVLAAIALFQPTGAGAADRPVGYRLGAGDLLQITVVGEADLTGKFRVGPDGAISYPLVGSLAAADRTVADLAQDLAARLAERAPTRSPPLVEVAEYAPVFAAGDFERPGQYAFRPGMVALELVAVAGGLRRPRLATDSLMLQVIAAEQEVADQRLARVAARVHRARIAAEIARGPFAPDAATLGDPFVPAADLTAIIDNEKALFEVRKTVLAGQQAALRSQGANFDQEIAALRRSIALHEDEIGLLQQEVNTAQGLVEKGLAPLPRLLASKRQLSATRRDALDLDSYLARARQNKLQIEQKIQELSDQQAKDNAGALLDLDLNLARIERKLRAATAALTETGSRLAVGPAQIPEPSFRIARVVGEAHVDLPADEFTRLEPRDILRVDRPEPTPAPARESRAPPAGAIAGR